MICVCVCGPFCSHDHHIIFSLDILIDIGSTWEDLPHPSHAERQSVVHLVVKKLQCWAALRTPELLGPYVPSVPQVARANDTTRLGKGNQPDMLHVWYM